MTIETDLNSRERTRFATIFRDISDVSTKAAIALEDEDDTQLILNMTLLLLHFMQTKELHKIIISSFEPDKSEFPGYIK